MTPPKSHRPSSILWTGMLLASLLFSGCSTATQPEAPALNNPESSTTPSSGNAQVPATANTNVKFKLEEGSERFTLKYKPDGAKLEDPSGAEIARLKVDGTKKVKIKGPDEQVLGYVVPTTKAWKLEDAEQAQELYILRRQEDGDYKLETSDDQPVYRIKKRDYGFEIESPQKKSLYKVKEKKGKISLRNAENTTVLYSKDSPSLISMACFGFDVLSQEQQAALAYAVSQ